MPAIDSNPVRLRRLAMGLTQIELARRAGVTRATIAQIEEGRVKRPNKKVLGILATMGGPQLLGDEYVAWLNEDITQGISPRARNVLSLPPSFVAKYTSFGSWRNDVAGNPTAFSSLLRVPRSTVVKYEKGEIAMPSSLYYALINRLNLSEQYVEELRKLNV